MVCERKSSLSTPSDPRAGVSLECRDARIREPKEIPPQQRVTALTDRLGKLLAHRFSPFVTINAAPQLVKRVFVTDFKTLEANDDNSIHTCFDSPIKWQID